MCRMHQRPWEHGWSVGFAGKQEMFSRQGAKNAKESMALFERSESAAQDPAHRQPRTKDRLRPHTQPQSRSIQRPVADGLMNSYGNVDDLLSHLVLRHSAHFS